MQPSIPLIDDDFFGLQTCRKLLRYVILLIFFIGGNLSNVVAQDAMSINAADTSFQVISYAELSKQLVEAVRDDKPYFAITNRLANVPEDELYRDLASEPEKKAFWINVYNAYVQILLLENPELFEDRNSWFGYNFFTTPQVTIAGKELSFDDIEHGIMRRSTNKLSLGYVQNWFVDDFVERFWWDEIDPRIHFVLNCGAISCPYIAPMDAGRVEEQLRIGAKEYLKDTTDYYPDENRVEVTRLISWFRGDFGGIDVATEMIKSYGIIPEDADPSVDFKEYDWTLELGNYKEL